MNKQEVQSHSKTAFSVWKKLWERNVAANRKKVVTSHQDAFNIFKDKEAVLFSYGPSFEQNIKEYKLSDRYNHPKVVLGCVDKAFRPLVERGIYPDYVLVADGSVSATKWLDGVPEKAIKRAKLISNVYGNPAWSQKWVDVSGKKNIYWYLNKDGIKSHLHFAPLVDYHEVIPAASNVGNSLVVFTAQIFGVKTIYLCAYDYSWKRGTYYGTCLDKKATFIGSQRCLNKEGEIVWASSNMDFSARWLDSYIIYLGQRNVQVINCTGDGILRYGGHYSLQTA